MKVLSRWHFYPASYVGDGVEAGCERPSSGHSRRKLTGLLTNLEDLDGLRGGGSADPVEGGLQERMKASRSWVRWAGEGYWIGLEPSVWGKSSLESG